LRVNVDEHRRGSAMDHHVRRGTESERRGDHFISWSNTQRLQSQLETCRARVKRNGVFAADVLTEKSLELSTSRSGTEPTGTQSVDYFLNLSFPDVRSAKE
jgi:hypothetical protein